MVTTKFLFGHKMGSYTYDLGEGYHENENFFYVLNEALRKSDHR
jgi:hypothetical protein